jgi:hypothetical protein
VDNFVNTVEKYRGLGITCDLISTKKLHFSPYVGGEQMFTGTFALKCASSSGIELNGVLVIPMKIHKVLNFAKSPDKPQIPPQDRLDPYMRGRKQFSTNPQALLTTTNINYNQG